MYNVRRYTEYAQKQTNNNTITTDGHSNDTNTQAYTKSISSFSPVIIVHKEAV